MTAVVDGADRFVGIFTDGDLRRALDRGIDVHATAVDQVMTRGGVTVGAADLAAAALHLMESRSINGLFVVDADGRPTGALNMHDLLRAGVV